jgi:hypothetical protein
MQPPKRKLCSNTSVEDVTAGELPQKRKKYDNMPEPGDVVDDMERLMDGINSTLPAYQKFHKTCWNEEFPQRKWRPSWGNSKTFARSGLVKSDVT